MAPPKAALDNDIQQATRAVQPLHGEKMSLKDKINDYYDKHPSAGAKQTAADLGCSQSYAQDIRQARGLSDKRPQNGNVYIPGTFRSGEGFGDK
jgi:hypothetical protein